MPNGLQAAAECQAVQTDLQWIDSLRRIVERHATPVMCRRFICGLQAASRADQQIAKQQSRDQRHQQ